MQANLLVQGKDKTDQCFDGYVNIKLRNSTTIGKLKLNINFSLLGGNDDKYGNGNKTILDSILVILLSFIFLTVD